MREAQLVGALIDLATFPTPRIARGLGPTGRLVQPPVVPRMSLYRAVSQAELADIRAFGGFRTAPRGNYEGGKLFAETLEDAQWWARSLPGEQPLVIVEVRIPRAFGDALQRLRIDRRIGVYVNEGVEMNTLNSLGELILP